jgi:Sulfotransferase family
MQPEISPVFVFGASHSGTTILYRILANHPDLTWFSQLSLGNGEIPGRRTRPGAGILDVKLRRVPHPWQKEESRLRRLVVPLPSDEATIWEYLLEDEGTDAQRVRSCLASFSERHGGRRILAKWPGFYRFLDRLHAACPDALYVHIVRDGRPLAFSIREKFERRRLDHHEALLAAAHHWVEVVERARATRGIDLHEIRYEDFCEDVHGVIRNILSRGRLDPESFPFRRCPPTLSAASNRRWIDEASPDELGQVSEIQRDRLIAYGYSV